MAERRRGRGHRQREQDGCCCYNHHKKTLPSTDSGSSSTLSSNSTSNQDTTEPQQHCRCCLSTPLLETLDIAIIGTGLAGLATALSLEQVGYRRMTLYERDAALETQKEGYGLTLSYDLGGPLAALGVLDALADEDCPSRSHYLLDPEGHIRGYFGNALLSSKRNTGQRGNLRVPRQAVRRVLYNQLQFSKIEWNHRLMDVVACGEERLELVFDRGEDHAKRIQADVVVAADGIRSRVVQSWIPRAPPPASLGVHVILGLSQGYVHALLQERGFYTAAPGIRLFVMPYAGTRLDPDTERRYMWQLSFASHYGSSDDNDSDSQSKDISTMTSEELWNYAMALCQHWHDPVPDLLRATPLATVWGTRLCERDPVPIYRHLQTLACQRVLVVGDALHAMSMFKGQGAMQSLQDARVVAQWLNPSHKHKTRRLDKAIKSCQRELVQRTQHVVYKSRLASQFWHFTDYDEDLIDDDEEESQEEDETEANSESHDDNDNEEEDETEEQSESRHVYDDNDTERDAESPSHQSPEESNNMVSQLRLQHFKFAGLDEPSRQHLVEALEEKGIHAGTPNLDQAIAQVIVEEGLMMEPPPQEAEETKKNAETNMELLDWEVQVWEATRQGDTGRLRRLSWQSQQQKSNRNQVISRVRDPNTGQALLHAAVQQGETQVVVWLVREAGCSIGACDQQGHTPLDVALANKDCNPDMVSFLNKLQSLEQQE